MAMKRIWKLSASFITTFKACAFRCYAAYVLGIRVQVEAEVLRVGSNWHHLLELMGLRENAPCPSCAATGPDPDCETCEGTTRIKQDVRETIRLALNEAYKDRPDWKSVEDWGAEKMRLWIAAVGYDWYHADDDFEVVASEIPFEIPLFDEDGQPIEGVVLVGKIDKITRSPEGVLHVDEHKSTSKDISSDSQYWSSLNLDTQTTLYVYAAQTLQLAGELEQYGITKTEPLICGVRYDVWKKPQIKPKDLSIADSKKFLETSTYCDENFQVTGLALDKKKNWIQPVDGDGAPASVHVTGEVVTMRYDAGPKKDKPVVRETSQMYGARIMQSIIENPEKHFARRTFARTEDDIIRFEKELNGIYKTVKFMEEGGFWWKCEQQCEATFKCQYLNQCYNNVELDPENPPEGFKCIFKRPAGDGQSIVPNTNATE